MILPVSAMKRLISSGIVLIALAMPVEAQIIEERQQADTSSVEARAAVVDADRMNKGLPETPGP